MIVDATAKDAVFDELKAARLPELPSGELKWGKVSRTKLCAYKRVVDAFWDGKHAQSFHFHSLVVDTTMLDHKRFNNGSREIGFSKEVFQMANKFSRIYGGLFHVYLDERNTNQKPEDLRLILNNTARKRGDTRNWPFRRCHFRDSGVCPALQLVDLFIGAVGFHMNGHINAPGASPAKIELARYVVARAGLKNVVLGTGVTGKFTIWYRQLRRPGGVR